MKIYSIIFFFQAEDGIRDFHVTGVQTCALPISQIPFNTNISAADRLLPCLLRVCLTAHNAISNGISSCRSSCWIVCCGTISCSIATHLLLSFINKKQKTPVKLYLPACNRRILATPYLVMPPFCTDAPLHFYTLQLLL